MLIAKLFYTNKDLISEFRVSKNTESNIGTFDLNISVSLKLY